MALLSMQPREYQKTIFETARMKNTLVVLPTGLGKTLIALLLAIDRLEKFPGSKALILAPTRPLVEQHLVSFQKQLHELFGTLELFTGEVPAAKRAKLFSRADIIFSTPQCIAHDVAAGIYNLSEVSLVVIDEAHRCLKNYDYTKVVDTYKRQAPRDHLRILGLTASPGHEAPKVREICKHLAIAAIEVRTRDSPDVAQYLQHLDFEKVDVPFPAEFVELQTLLRRIWDSCVSQLKQRDLVFGPANKITLLLLQKKLAARAQQNDWQAMTGMSLTAQAIKIAHAQELLETQTLSGLHAYMKGLQKQAATQSSKGVQKLVAMPEFNAAMVSLEILRMKHIEHPKIEAAAAVIYEQFLQKKESKMIVFSQFRETGTQIAARANKLDGVRAATFFGQAKKGDTGSSQKEQKAIIEQFKTGTINVLCATSIGEEGLDIPEVSAVLFYEPIPSAIRKIQRAGRTARLAPGKLIILVTENTRDVSHHFASKAREKKMYSTIELVQKELERGMQNVTLDDFKS